MFRNVLFSSITLLGLLGTNVADAAVLNSVSGDNAASSERSPGLDRAATMNSAFLRGANHAPKLGGNDISFTANNLRYDDMPIMRDGRFFFSVIGTSFDYSLKNGQF